MRLTTVIILLTAFQLSADVTYGQKLRYVKSNTTIKELFRQIKIQTGFNVIWFEGKLNSQTPIDARYYGTTLDRVMDDVLTMRGLTFEMIGKAIVVKPDDRPESSIFKKFFNIIDKVDVKGRVLGEGGMPLGGAVIRVKGVRVSVVSDEEGRFELKGVKENVVLVISHLSYETLELKIPEVNDNIQLTLRTDELEEVDIVSTGYQELPKERATGSFTHIDNKLLSRSVGTNILDRLKGITNGLLFENTTNTTGNALGISVRGRSTIFSNTSPLIVVDNFPFEGDINTINPEMVESVTILKDAAAASIWGVKAGNGVIVITTKKGKFEEKQQISAKLDLTVGEKPDLYYQQQLNSNEFINIEHFLFQKGAFNSTINNGYSTVSPVVASLQKVKLQPGYAEQSDEEIDILRKIDYRDQQSKYFFRNSLLQHYFVDTKGGGGDHVYYFSVGYDRNLPNLAISSDSRVNLKANNSYSLLGNRIKLNSDLNFSKSLASSNLGTRNGVAYLPYEQIADERGNSLETVFNGGLRTMYTDTAGRGKLLDWKYRPLDELRKKLSINKRQLIDYRINLGLNYNILDPLRVSINYQYYNADSKAETLHDEDSFYTRNIINTYSQINDNTGEVKRAIPLGDIYNPSFESKISNYLRTQFDFNHFFKDKHKVSVLAGYEIREDKYTLNNYTLYGYKQETMTDIQIDPLSLFNIYPTGGLGRVGQATAQSGVISRFISMFGNASYTYIDRYIVSGSYRKDESNLFGVKANQKGVPLWSAGIAWNIHKEPFFTVNWLSSLQLKATYGYNGNVNSSISAYLTASPSNINLFNNLLYYRVVNPPNESLTWERVKNLNVGAFFSTKGNRISGSVEFFIKDGKDLIASSPIAPQTGVSLFTGNTADTHAKGIDLEINTRNLANGIKWSTTFIFNYIEDEIKKYKVAVGANNTVVSSYTGRLAPLVGYPINLVSAYKWAGLDASGNPQGYLNGQVSQDFTKIRNLIDINQLEIFGSAVPTKFGSLRNTISYKNLEFSFNITYKTGYYFKRQSLDNRIIFNGGNFRVYDFDKRWQKAGDELKTNVPSLIYPANTNRNDFYLESSVLVEKGDHIRLQDVQLNYFLSKDSSKLIPFSEVSFYVYLSNLWVVWRKNKFGLDPDIRSGYPYSKRLSLGMKINF